MDFFQRVEQVDGAVSRFYARWKVWVWSVVLLPVMYGVIWTVWMAFWGVPAGGVALIAHSKIDRPILVFSVNGMAGPNTGVYNPDNPSSGVGINSVCCGSIRGKTAEVIWTLDVTGPQYDAGMRPEERRVVMPMPERKRGENDLHVHFLPGDKVLLGWSDNAWSPYDPRNPKNRTAVNHREKSK